MKPQPKKQNRQPHSPGRGSAKSNAVWVGSKKPVFIFVGLFVLLMGLFYAVTFLPTLNNKLLPELQAFNAKAATAVMNVFGEGAWTDKTNITSERYSVNIKHGCDAIEPIALFVAAVLAFPAPLRTKWPGLLIGTLVLTALNIVRIISLFYIGIYWPKAFDAMHEDVWQPAFIVLSLLFWVLWALWATKPRTGSAPPDLPPASRGDAHAYA